MPQKAWATMAISSSSSPPWRPIASMKICAGGTPVADVSAFEYSVMFGMANSDRRR